jgi:hypothetical protein
MTAYLPCCTSQTAGGCGQPVQIDTRQPVTAVSGFGGYQGDKCFLGNSAQHVAWYPPFTRALAGVVVITAALGEQVFKLDTNGG